MKFLLFTALAAAATLSAAAEGDTFPPLISAGDVTARGAAIQRTMTLLETSAVEKKNRVRVLFYGQSITEQDWWKEVHRDLLKRFPLAKLEVENLAIGGHAAQLLEKTAEADLYPWQPDLVIFHVYGAHDSYERIVRRIRERTSAEVIIQTDHLGAKDLLDEPTSNLKQEQWNPWINYSFLPATAKKYGCELLPVRDMWKAYLRENKLEPRALLKDDVHLNAQGSFLMAEAVKSGLVYRRDDKTDAWSGLVKEVTLTDASWKEDTLTVEFDGNRVDGVWGGTAGVSAAGGAASLRIDGKPPEELRQMFTFTRTTAYDGTNWPCLLRVQRGSAQLVEEEWTITLAHATPDYQRFLFSVTGSKTGPDGIGSARKKFVSKSKRIVIEPDDWNLQFAQRTFGRRLPEGFRITFKSVPQWDTLPLGSGTFVKGLLNGKHTLELSGAGIRRSGLTGLLIYRPTFPQTEDPAADKSAE